MRLEADANRRQCQNTWFITKRLCKNTDILHKPDQPLTGNKVVFDVCVGLIRLISELMDARYTTQEHHLVVRRGHALVLLRPAAEFNTMDIFKMENYHTIM